MYISIEKVERQPEDAALYIDVECAKCGKLLAYSNSNGGLCQSCRPLSSLEALVLILESNSEN